ncbi:signal peptidase I [Sporosarcina luteola]|nr:signal peptidase I [Sporosarcina luteola]
MIHEKQFEKLANELKQVDRTQNAKISSWAIINSRVKKKKLHLIPVILTCAMTVMISFLLFNFIQDSDSPYHHSAAEIPIIELPETAFSITYTRENMERGHYEYMTTATRYKVIIKPLTKNFKRGDVVYYKTPEYINGVPGIPKKRLSLKENLGLNVEEHQLSRIVGLPGETIAIKKGQIYINDEKLDTFYSYPTFRGMRKDEYLKTNDVSKSSLTKKDFEEDMDTIEIPEDSVFVMGDQWSRSVDSRLFGPLSISEIQGLAIGYEKNK